MASARGDSSETCAHGMDPSLALVARSSQPVQLTDHAALLPGAFGPVALPLEWLPPEGRARWLLAPAEAPPAGGGAAGAEGGVADGAWAALAARAEPLGSDPRLEAALSRWSNGE